ncbi:MAG: hypothetical protein JSV80_17350 [Acidobacteriota bacterium]|nr:MAG: hypothetical protein JSV80_17350 [Acidobacteriota bacterium]
MIDTHCHLLPGIDDGPQDVEAAVAMARVACQDGIKTIVVTPHMREGDYLNERPKILDALAYMRVQLQLAGVALELEAGSEVHLGPRMVERIEQGRLLTYADQRRYLLLECPYRSPPVGLEKAVFELKVAGITPVLAHPERIRFFLEEPARYEEALRLGALGQLTSSSLLGTFGPTIQRVSEDWVRRGMVHLLASDAHDADYRPPRLAKARERWAELAGEESATRAAMEWPEALLRGDPITPEPPLSRERRPPGLLRRLFGGRP